MSNILFQKYIHTLESELFSQLTPIAKGLYKSASLEGNSLYFLGEKLSLPARDIAIIRQLNDCKKRYIGDSDSAASDDRDSKCEEKFLLAVSACEKQNLAMESLDCDLMTTLERARCDIDVAFWRALELDDPEFVWNKDNLVPVSGFSSGPGTCTGTDGTALIEKFRNKWYFSNPFGKRHLLLQRKLSKPLNDLPNFEVEHSEYVKATYVPKDHTISRLIAPQLNGDLHLQYPADSFLRKMLKSFNIDLSEQQDINREMARKGSIHDNCDLYSFSIKNRKVRFCTLDLVSASDIVGIALVRFLSPVPLFNYLDGCRSDAISSRNVVYKLPMMATMGNAYCFPLQTLIFTSLVRAVYWRLGLPYQDMQGFPTYSVYGDDIIVDVVAYPYIVELLKCLHMQPNLKKSFSTGLFRESCGADFFCGYNIRPVFCEELRTVCDVYSLSNRLIDWGLSHSVSISKTVAVLLASVAEKVVVPLDYGAHEGLRIPAEFLSIIPKDWRSNVKTWTSQSRGDLLSPRDLNTYNNISIQSLDITVEDKHTRLRKDENSLFYFLRGGISQSSSDLRVFLTPWKGRQKLVHNVRLVPYWNSVPFEGNHYERLYLEQLNCNYTASLARIFVEAPLS